MQEKLEKTYITCLKMLDMSIQGEPICCLGIAKPRQLKKLKTVADSVVS